MNQPLVSIRADYARLALTCALDDACDVRFHLQALRVEPRPTGGAWIIGTDGHTMAVIEDEGAACTEPAMLTPDGDLCGELPCLMRGEDEPGRLQMLLNPGGPVLQLTNCAGDVVHTQERRVRMPAQRQDGRPWYDWRRVIPDVAALKPGLSDPFHPPYVARMLDAFVGSPQLIPMQAAPETAIVLQVQHWPQVLLLVMPQAHGAWIGEERAHWLARWAAAKSGQPVAQEAA